MGRQLFFIGAGRIQHSPHRADAIGADKQFKT